MIIAYSPEYHIYWSRQHILATPIFILLMRRDQFELLGKMVNFSNPKNEDPMDSLRKWRFFLVYLIARYKENYSPEEHLEIDEYLSLRKGSTKLSYIYYNKARTIWCSDIHPLWKQNRLFITHLYRYYYQMLRSTWSITSEILWIRKFIKVVLPFFHDYLHKGCVTLDNSYTFPESVDALLLCNTDCCGTLWKKQGLPNQFWEWKPKKGNSQNHNPKA